MSDLFSAAADSSTATLGGIQTWYISKDFLWNWLVREEMLGTVNNPRNYTSMHSLPQNIWVSVLENTIAIQINLFEGKRRKDPLSPVNEHPICSQLKMIGLISVAPPWWNNFFPLLSKKENCCHERNFFNPILCTAAVIRWGKLAEEETRRAFLYLETWSVVNGGATVSLLELASTVTALTILMLMPSSLLPFSY